MKRAVITGIGAVAPIGNRIEDVWEALIAGRSGIARITRFDVSRLKSKIGGELKGFDSSVYLDDKESNRLDAFVHYAAASAFMARQDAGLIIRDSLCQNAGVIIGSSRGGIATTEKALSSYLTDNKRFSAYLMPATTISMASSYIATRLGIRGLSLGVSNACASGMNAIGEGMRLIQRGELDVVFAGGAEAPICQLALGGYAASNALSRRNDAPEQASRPFDAERDGFVVSEGAAVLVLESLDHALKRNAPIYAELVGYGVSADAFHQTQPFFAGQALAMVRALSDAQILPAQVDYINAHAASTVIGDKAETEAIKAAFGPSAYRVSISASKSMLGHTLGASGALGAAIATLALKHSTIPQTINLVHPDPECDLNYEPIKTFKPLQYALVNAFGFGGVNAVLIIEKYNHSGR
jgi:3-oxoacyl-[acyl-carrier-protein] synthase II